MSLAPIVLLVYARPEHTRRTLESLAANPLAAESELFIFADGPKADASPTQRENIRAVRRLIQERSWCGQVHIEASDTNRGLANSVIRAVNWLIASHGRVIVLEDDLLLGKHYLDFMNQALDLYADEEQVFSVSGYASWTPKPMPDSYFLPILSSWGWGTWKRAWQHFEPDAGELLHQIEASERLDAFDFGGQNNHEMLRLQAAGKLDSWAIRFYASLFLRKGLVLFPGKSLVQNIGYDASGTHCQEEEEENIYTRVTYYDHQPIQKIPVRLEPKAVAQVRRARRSYHNPSIQDRIRRRVNDLLKK